MELVLDGLHELPSVYPQGILSADVIAAERLDRLADPRDVVFLGGSRVEGLGNAWSDLDVYVVTDEQPASSAAFLAGGCLVSIQYLGGHRVDYEYWPHQQVGELAERLRGFRLGVPPIETLFSETEEQLIHRIHAGAVECRGHIASLREKFSREALRLYQLQLQIKRLDGLHEDLCGMLDGRSWGAAAFTARALVEAALDAYLHYRGNTNPTRKWRALLALRFAGADDPVVRQFYELQFPSASILSGPEALLEYCRRCIAYHASIVRTVQVA